MHHFEAGRIRVRRGLTGGKRQRANPCSLASGGPKGLSALVSGLAFLTTAGAIDALLKVRPRQSNRFTDLKGSMDLGEKVDPEEWYRIMDRFFQILSDGVHRFEGTVDKFTGDGI
jgi:class 3 adenylate cyclase